MIVNSSGDLPRLELFARQDSGSTHSTVTADAGIQTFMAGFRLL